MLDVRERWNVKIHIRSFRGEHLLPPEKPLPWYFDKKKKIVTDFFSCFENFPQAKFKNSRLISYWR